MNSTISQGTSTSRPMNRSRLSPVDPSRSTPGSSGVFRSTLPRHRGSSTGEVRYPNTTSTFRLTKTFLVTLKPNPLVANSGPSSLSCGPGRKM